MYPNIPYTVDREIFMLKIICVKNFRGVKFSRFCSIREIFLTVDGYDVDESAWRVSGVYSTTRYQENQVLLAVYSRRLPRPQNYFNSEIFPIYGSLKLSREKTLLVPLKDAMPPNFPEKIFANSHKTLKSTKVFSLKSSLQYGSLVPRPSHRRVLITSVSKTRRWEGLGMRLLQPRSLGLVTDYVPNVALTQ